ncbi:hypothetical protein, partial [Vallitalea longa]|uniref:hypothetical protein n=1 Tax=Vallitalea longa TaxID=2936439 RepID=UPI00248FECFF
MKKRILSCIVIFIIIISNSSYEVYGGWGDDTNKADVVEDPNDGLQYLVFDVNSKTSTAQYKYKTIGWDITFYPEGEDSRTARIDYDFANHGGNNNVKILLEDVFNQISESVDEKDRLKQKDGYLIADAIQIILINDVPMGTNGKPISYWNGDFKSLLENNSQDAEIFTDEASNILNGLPNGMKWGPNTQKNLKYYYNQKAPYDKLYSII